MNIHRNTHFLLDKEKNKSDARLRFRIKWDSYTLAFNVGYRIEEKKWSLETQRCINNSTHGKKKVPASLINKEIQRFENAAQEAFTFFEREQRSPTQTQFKDQFNILIGKQTLQTTDIRSFFDVFDKFVETTAFMNSWTHRTHLKFSLLRKNLYHFNSKLSFDNISNETLQYYVQYLVNKRYKNDTIANSIKNTRAFLRWAANNGYYTGIVHQTYKPKLKGTGSSKEVIHLTWEELIHLFNFPIENIRLQKVRDVFCFCCFTGLRYSDVQKLNRNDIHEDRIYVVTKKTIDSLSIELNKYSREILERYQNFPIPQNRALPVISNVQMNKFLKELGELVGIKTPQRIVYFIGSQRYDETYPKYELLTTHCGRRTFIVNALYLGIPAEVIMKWTGHSDYKAMQPYVKIVDKLKVQEMDKFNQK